MTIIIVIPLLLLPLLLSGVAVRMTRNTRGDDSRGYNDQLLGPRRGAKYEIVLAEGRLDPPESAPWIAKPRDSRSTGSRLQWGETATRRRTLWRGCVLREKIIRGGEARKD